MKPRFLKVINTPETSFHTRWSSANYFDTPWHFHPELELNLILHSTGTRFVGDHIGRFGPGDLVLIGSNLPHLWKNDAAYYLSGSALKAEAVNIRFSVEEISLFSKEMPELAKVFQLIDRARQGIIIQGNVKKQVTELMLAILKQTGFKRLITLFTILDLLSANKNYQLLSNKTFMPHTRRKDEKRMNVIYDYVFRNFNNEITLETIAGIIYMNPSSFSRYFKQCAGKSFSDFLIEIRIGNACKMLIETDQNISSIIYECGFNNQSNFNSFFKKKMGIAPLAYRKKYNQ